MEWIESNPEARVLESEYHRLLGFPPGHVVEGRAQELARAARAWYAEHGRPWTCIRAGAAVDAGDSQVSIGGTAFGSRHLREQIIEAGAHEAAIAAVSAGPECEEEARRLWEEGKPDEYFFMEMFGSAVVEHLVTAAGARMCAWAESQGMAVLPHYSPGYSGWDISDQPRLWNLLQAGGGAELPGRLEVLETGMLKPKKSLLAVFAVTRHVERMARFARLVPCESCSFSPCQYRRAAYRNAQRQIEDVHRFLPSAPDGREGAAMPRLPLERNARYTVNRRALEKWSRERLHLHVMADRTVQARFRYEGTTCSNLGHPLAYDYHVRIGVPEEGCRVLEAGCVPAPGDDGFTFMCAYRDNPELLMSAVGREKPLLGRPLNDVLTWARKTSPSGCYCDADSRNHKWGLVLEVIHFALVQRDGVTAAFGSEPEVGQMARVLE
jgi:hypothetical protein